MQRRNAVEPIIGHMKADGRLGCCPLKGIAGDANFASLCGCGQKLTSHSVVLAGFFAPVFVGAIAASPRLLHNRCDSVSCASSGLAGLRVNQTRLNNLFKEGELSKAAVVKESLTTATDGKQYKTRQYNLDVIISVDYRVKSQRGTQFRPWATRALRNHLTKGWTLSRQRLEANAGELEAAMALVQKATTSPELQFDRQE